MHRYLIALGSNVRHARFGRPEQVLTEALHALEASGLRVERAAPLIRSAPIGPSTRRYANSAAVVVSELEPDALLKRLKATERAFGRKRGGQRWASRVLDLDIVLWSGGCWAAPDLTIPHREFRRRDFVLTPAVAIAAGWRDPLTQLTLRQLHRRLNRPHRA
ncbi:MAG: 2-amino-4-hydroxy-6-hydroxymethyldihydropteridine diphosphokinase [Pseudomonadota bacterium]|nr:2-amino-4-hydroxy-6-hydroxymethyldihydropteridine diphosphokinase [Novosphingobium sp.]HOA49802.1 2-amino-4-hydroxy-6-hydroxymethyldihydropteridine diphosphokinase [Novosphingobium sp.]HPB21439.1 2-amino-4-hydroxy-6-hydroxymethyldihydropteridine diphosphokinase [Novosphingobium sp.]HPZ46843.1 2-amino-4-hydroxy-6-hydroxymethyldihydropteridine diphosphokinase [Novosphingobium sp.]HQD99130.1 2-amino-4-hydroxy-6-hydroxymethyldihydropteridine diphosphokinase [Novosphingobium sp.]